MTASMVARVAGCLTLALGSGAALGQAEYRFTLVESFTPSYNLAECYLFDVSEQGLGCGTSTYATQVNGNTSIGYAGYSWTEAGGKAVLPTSMTTPRAVNNHGWVASTTTIYDVTAGAFVTTSMPLPPGGAGGMVTLGLNDAGTAVGYALTCNCSNSQGLNQVAFVWDQASGTHAVAVPGAKELLRVNASGLACGNTRAGGGTGSGFVYDTVSGAYTLFSPLLPQSEFGMVKSVAKDVSDAGVVTGDAVDPNDFHHRGYTWSAADGFTVFAGFGGATNLEVYPQGINAGGTVVGYASYDPASAQSFHAFVWDSEHGIRDLNALASEVPEGFIIERALKVNDQGWIVGDGHFGPGWATSRAFVLKPSGAGPCYANCDGSAAAPILNVADFSCFLQKYAAGDASANCDGSVAAPVLNVLDFSCFLQKFAAGCP